ncbi:MAG: hypothetical protein RLZZ618_4057 [Pseudomonadota bacterium]
MMTCLRASASAATTAALILFTGCTQGGLPADASRAVLYRGDGSVQCEASGKSITATRSELEVAGVQVLDATCGNNGRAQIAMCGSATGRIHIVAVPGRQVQAARALGFAPLSDLPEASRKACR